MSTEVIVAFITGVLGPILILVSKKLLEKKQKPDLLLDTLKECEVVTKKLEEIREEFNSDRVWVAQFHNGGNFYPTGKSMAKFSFIYEVVNVGVNSIQSNFQNIPVNLFSKPINELLENDMIQINDFQDPTVATYGLKYIAEENGVKSAYHFAIKTIDGKFIGAMCIEYTKKKTKLDQSDILHLNNYSAQLASYLVPKNN